VQPENAHLTLVFFGEVEEARVPALVDAIGGEVALPPFEMVLEGAGVFRRAARRAPCGSASHAARDPLSGVQRAIAGASARSASRSRIARSIPT
jgi:2'-5' RNA ligase